MDPKRSKSKSDRPRRARKRTIGGGGGGGALASMIMWLPLVAGGVAMAWFAARKHLGSSTATLSKTALPRPKPRPIERLRAAIIGNDKAAVAAVFGPPRASAGFSSIAPTMLVWSDYLHADTWYYPLDKAAKAALVVQFDNGIAQNAMLVQSPGA